MKESFKIDVLRCLLEIAEEERDWRHVHSVRKFLDAEYDRQRSLEGLRRC